MGSYLLKEYLNVLLEISWFTVVIMDFHQQIDGL